MSCRETQRNRLNKERCMRVFKQRLKCKADPSAAGKRFTISNRDKFVLFHSGLLFRIFPAGIIQYKHSGEENTQGEDIKRSYDLYLHPACFFSRVPVSWHHDNYLGGSAMKKCNNPYCECEQTFSDDTKLCPFCGSELTPVENTAHSRMHTADELLDFPASPPALPLVTAGVLGHTVVRGSVLEIDHSSLFYSGFHKWCNAIFCGEPWQFAHQSQAYTLRLEEISPDNIPGRVIDICAFGDFLGRFSIGDELEVHCTGTKNRRIAKKIINKTTGSLVRPGLQIPALFIRLFSLIAALVVIWLAVTGIRLVTSGAIVSLVFGAVATLLGLVWQLLAAFGGSILGLIGIVIIIRSCLPRRK